jgi:hypothetical protein
MIFTEGRKGSEATKVGPRQISKQAKALPLMMEFHTMLRDLLFKTNWEWY